jgi:hypothetical protein
MDCRYFEDCSAPLCPKADNTDVAAWFPDEPVCRLADVPGWVKRQRKLARKGMDREAGYFTAAMLAKNCVWKGGIKGIDPDGTDREREAALSAWFAKHPELKPVSDTEREKRSIRMLKKMSVDNGIG